VGGKKRKNENGQSNAKKLKAVWRCRKGGKWKGGGGARRREAGFMGIGGEWLGGGKARLRGPMKNYLRFKRGEKGEWKLGKCAIYSIQPSSAEDRYQNRRGPQGIILKGLKERTRRALTNVEGGGSTRSCTRMGHQSRLQETIEEAVRGKRKPNIQTGMPCKAKRGKKVGEKPHENRKKSITDYPFGH